MTDLLEPTSPSPTPETFESDFVVPEGQLTFDAEGQEVRGPYFSRKPHWPGGASGVTIGRGYDMRERTQETIVSELTAAGVPRADAELLAHGARLTGDEAAQFIARSDVKALQISPMAQKKLFSAVYGQYAADVKRISSKPDTVARYGNVDWENLNPAIKDVAVDLRYRGDYTPATRREIQELIAYNDLQGLHAVLSDEAKMIGEWRVPRDRFERRREYLAVALKAR